MAANEILERLLLASVTVVIVIVLRESSAAQRVAARLCMHQLDRPQHHTQPIVLNTPSPSSISPPPALSPPQTYPPQSRLPYPPTTSGECIRDTCDRCWLKNPLRFAARDRLRRGFRADE